LAALLDLSLLVLLPSLQLSDFCFNCLEQLRLLLECAAAMFALC
jgi:hypothetical protein